MKFHFLTGILSCCLLAAASPHASAGEQAELSVQVLGYWQGQQINPAMSAVLPGNTWTVDSELKGSYAGINATVTLQGQQISNAVGNDNAWVNELYVAQDVGSWQLAAGRKIVEWDIGYAFRPNDLVQQETRLQLVNTTPTGRLLLMAERFDAESAWSFVLVNPEQNSNATFATLATPATEPALNARYYLRSGSLDAYVFADEVARNGAGIGAAAAWVANDETELHASVHLAQQNTSTKDTVQQWLLGATWTNTNQLSVLAETWWDDKAVRPLNTYLRLYWTHEAWEPALDVLYTPADKGQAVTASLLWKGNKIKLQGGVRIYGGPADSLMAQLPASHIAYFAGTWAF